MVAELIMEASNILRKRVNDDTSIPHSGNMSEASAQSSNQAYFRSQEYYIHHESFKLFVGSWNVGGVRPPDNLNLDKLLNTEDTMADIYVLGFQEIVPLNAGNILATENSDVSVKWNSLIKAALNKRTPAEDTLQKTEIGESQRIYPLRTQSSTKSNATDYKCIISKQMVGIYITIWARTELHQYINNLGVSCVGCGILGRLGNKGSVSVRFCLHETSFCFVCSHLASGGKEGDERHRNADAAHILARTLFLPEPLRHLPRKILDHDRVIWLGDLNYRIHLPEDTTRSLVKNKEWSLLLENDQNSDDYYGSGQKIKVKRMRAPAWCDRIIWFGKGLKQIQYNRVESRLSDHRPVYARFTAYVEVSKLPGMQSSALSS
ncbi:type IV inositol polyphosphate 5-phosphatase 9-like isoform X2 [Salvia hispanica]|uniref:type IV inositol polyphosphate 5-phosphatase 9-like isoform X2 n=1 Tax=Salvia hispanica TaxID=49212 RepID=UPI00200962B1|nr:type IV inositol polyphosphate 5-phosphatase 9-like isoform X2 [Salvia hispanica]